MGVKISNVRKNNHKRSLVMIEIIGHFTDRTVRRVFDNVLDAIDYRDTLDAHYAKVEWNRL
jgi:hypothetical protein